MESFLPSTRLRDTPLVVLRVTVGQKGTCSMAASCITRLPLLFLDVSLLTTLDMEKYCISVDWLQVYCLNNLSDVPQIGYADCKEFTSKKLDRVTPLWQEVYTIFYQGIEVAEYCRFPRSSALDAKGCTIKLHNRVLYSAQFIDILKSVIKFLQVSYVGVTRLDICYDCNYLHRHRSVHDFLFQYFVHAPYCSGHIIRNGSRRVQVNATRTLNGATTISAMRWGSKSSAVGVYCYNKSLELLEVHDKPWIRAAWENAGLVNDYDDKGWNSLDDRDKQKYIEWGKSSDYVIRPVWRFEISIKSEGRDILNLSTGQLFRIDLSYLTTQKYIEHLFYIYANKYLDFRESTGQSEIRNYPKMCLFEISGKTELKPIHLNKCAETGRTEKVAANRLKKLAETYSDLTTQDLSMINAAINFLYEISGMKKHAYEKRKYETYFDHMTAYKSLSAEKRDYFLFLQYAHERHMEFQSSTVAEYVNLLNEAFDYVNDDLIYIDNNSIGMYNGHD